MNESYGYGGRDTLYYAQTMFGPHRGGMEYGNVGNPNLGTVTDINSQDDQTFNPEAIGYLDQTEDVPSVGQAIPNLMPQYGATAPPSRQTARPNEAPSRPTVVALDPYEHARQNARLNAQANASTARRNEEGGASSAPAAGAAAGSSGGGVSGGDAMGLVTAVFGLGTSILGSIVQSRAVKSQAAMASQAAAEQLALVEAQARLAQAQSQMPQAPGTPWGTIFLGLGGLVVVSGGMYMLINSKKKKKKVAAPAGV